MNWQGTSLLVGLACCWLAQADVEQPAPAPTPVPAITEEDLHTALVPAWAKETFPPAMEPFLGKAGLPEPWRSLKYPLGRWVKGIDRWQANRFLVYRPETAAYLYGEYTPTTITWPAGTLPAYEALAAKYTTGLTSATDKALALLTKALPAHMMHPSMAPLGPSCKADRGLDDEALLASGTGFCNEQARVFVRLCQVSGIPARVLHLFWAGPAAGHTIVEFYADGRWVMADSSWFVVFPGPDGKLMSAVECHGNAEQRAAMARAYRTRFDAIVAMDDEALVGKHIGGDAADPKRAETLKLRAAKVREGFTKQTLEYLAQHLKDFGFVNYPVPR